MSASDGDPEEPAGDGRTVCGPCRGTGQVTSTLGGEAHQVACPWCDGTGEFIPGRDAQEHPAEQQQQP